MESTAATNYVDDFSDFDDTSSSPPYPSPRPPLIPIPPPPPPGTTLPLPPVFAFLTRLARRSNENITRIDSELYQAAVEGNFNKFIDIDNIDRLLTPNKNTVLHIHLTSTTAEATQSFSLSQPFVRKVQGKFHDLILKKVETAVASRPFVEQILDKCGGLILLPNSKGETPFHLAARYGHSTITELLIERAMTLPRDDIESGIGAEKMLISAKTQGSEDTALHEAVRHNHVDVVEVLLEKDSDDIPNIANKAKETPLYLASERQYTPIVKKILEKVESPAYGGPDGRTALHAAVIHSDLEMVVDLLNNEHLRVAVAHQDNKLWVPLYYAVEAGNIFLTEMLLKHDKNTAYMQDIDGCTALHIAAKCGHSFIAEMIIRYCPDCSELVDDRGCNALHYAVASECDSVVARIMLNLSLSNLYNEKDKDGDTPLHQLANSRIKSKDLMFHRRVDKLAFNNKNQTALDLAYATVEYSPLRKQNTIQGLEKAGAKRSQRIYIEPKKKSKMLMFTKEAKESHLIVATLIATVAFAAACTLPGGTFQDGELKGSPILRDKASFKAFIVSNTISMVMATSAAFIHLFSPLNKVKWLDYYLSEAAFSFTVVAIATMIVAFVTGMYAVLGSSSIGIAVITLGLLFFLVFKQVLRMSLGAYPFLTFMKNLANVILFPFIRFAARPFGMFFLLFRRFPDQEDPTYREDQIGWEISHAPVF